MKRKVTFNGYTIDATKKVWSIGDFDERNKKVLIDKRVPCKFWEGFAVHEIEERKWLKKGYSYGQAHNKAQDVEQRFYERLLGSRAAAKRMLKEEEIVVLKISQEDFKQELKRVRVKK